MRPRVLVGIPTLNGPDRLRRCVAAIAGCADLAHHDVRLLVADDGSEPDVIEANKQVVHDYRAVAGLEMLYGHGRTGVARSWNRLVRHASNDVCAIVNDDVEVVDHWLDVLVYSVVENSRAGMVGLNSYVGVIKGQVPIAPRIDYHEAHLMHGGGSLLASCGSIFAFRREVFDAVGGFDERYFLFYEEVDFGCMLRERGYHHYMATFPIVYHAGGATTSDPKNVNAVECMAESRGKFFEKWGKTPVELRAAFRNSLPSNVREWNTQLEFLKD